MRERLGSRESLLASVTECIAHAVAREHEDEYDGNAEERKAWLQFYQHALTTNYTTGANLIHDHAGSEIERVFLGSLLIGFLLQDPLSFVVTAPFRDAPAHVEHRRAAYSAVQEVERRLSEGEHGPRAFESYLDWFVREQGMPPEEAEHLRTIYLVGGIFGRAFHLTMQPGFPAVRVNGRSIRCDALVWVPTDPAVQVVLECDGYEWHSDRTTFTADRQRDRALRAAGFDVIRYSGSEVWHDPIGTSADFAMHLAGLRKLTDE